MQISKQLSASSLTSKVKPGRKNSICEHHFSENHQSTNPPSNPPSNHPSNRRKSSSCSARSASVSKVSWMCGDSQKVVFDRIVTIKRTTKTDCETCKNNEIFCPTHKIDQSKSVSFRPVASSETLARRNKNIFQVNSGQAGAEVCSKDLGKSGNKVKRGSVSEGSIVVADRVRTSLMRERRLTSEEKQKEHKLAGMK